MPIGQIDQSAVRDLIERLEDRDDINANALATYFENDEVTAFESEESSGVDSTSGDTGRRRRFPRLGGFFERIRNWFGNYISNDETDETQGTSETGGSDRAEGSSGSDGLDIDGIGDRIEEVEEDIEETQFQLEHAGLTEEQWDAFINALRALGLDDIADYLEAHPEYAAEYIDMISDPDAYWESLQLEAEAAREADADLINDVAQRVQDAIDQIADALGLDKVTFHGEGAGSGCGDRTVYRDENGNYYDIYFDSETGEIVVVQVTVDAEYQFIPFTPICIGKTYKLENYRNERRYDVDEFADQIGGVTEEELEALKSVEERVEEMHEENMHRMGLPEDWDPRDVALEDNEIECLAEYRDMMWLGEDGSYLYIDEKTLEFTEDLIKMYTLKSLLFMLVSAYNSTKQLVQEATLGVENKEGETDLVEVAQIDKDAAMTKLRYTLHALQKYINSHNNCTRQEKLNDAKQRAYDDARSDAGSIAAAVLTWGASSAMDRKQNELEQRYTAEVEEEYEAFQRRVEEKYEAALDGLNFDGGDPFGSAIDGIMNDLGIDSLMVDVGGGNIDINQNQENGMTVSNEDGTGIRDQLIAKQNVMKLWYMLKLAVAKLQQSVHETSSGREIKHNADGLVLSTINDILQFQQTSCSELINKMLGIRDTHNAAVYAREMEDYWHDMWIGSMVSMAFFMFSEVGGMWIDQHVETWRRWDDLSAAGKAASIVSTCLLLTPITGDPGGLSIDFYESDLQIDEAKVEEIMQQLRDARTKMGQDIVNCSVDELALVIQELEAMQWKLIASLDGQDMLEIGDEDLWSLNDKGVNQLRTELVALQNLQRLIFMLVRAKTRLSKMVSKLSLGQSVKLTEQLDTNTLTHSMENRLLAFELKLSNLKNRINQHNKHVLDHLRQLQTAFKAIFAVVGIAAAVVLLATGVVSGGTTLALAVVAAIGFIAALGSLGAALGNIIFHAAHPVDADFCQSEDFFEQRPIRQTGTVVADKIAELEREAERQIDRINGDSHINVGRTGIFTGQQQWALDPEIFMEVNNELRRILTLTNLMKMLAEAQVDQKTTVAGTTGATIQGNSDFVTSALQAVHKVYTQAVGAKQDMLQDIIAAHNRQIASDEDFWRSVVSGAISLASTVTAGVGSSISNQATQVVGQVLSVLNTLWNTATACIDRYSKNEILPATQDAVNEIIQRVYKQQRNSRNDKLAETQREVMEALNSSALVVGIGGGKIAVDVAAYYALRHEIEKLYNIEINQANLIDARTKLIKSIAQKTGLATGSANTSALDDAHRAKDAALKDLEILNVNLNNYVDRHNQIEDAAKAMTMSLVSLLLEAFMVFFKYCDCVEVGGRQISLQEALNNWLSERFGGESTGNALRGLNGRARAIVGNIIGGTNSDGNIGVGDLVNGLIDMLMSPEFSRMIATAIYEAAVDNEGEGEEEGQNVVNNIRGKSLSRSTSGSLISRFEEQAFAEEISLGNIELDGQKDEVIRLLTKEIMKQCWSIAKRFKNSIGSIRQQSENYGNGVVDPRNQNQDEETAAPQAPVAPAEENQEVDSRVIVPTVPRRPPTRVRSKSDDLKARIEASMRNPDPVAAAGAGAVAVPQVPREARVVRTEQPNRTARVAQPQPREVEVTPAEVTARRILDRVNRARQASEQFNGEEVIRELSSLKAEIQRITIQLPGSTNPEVAQVLTEIRTRLKSDMSPEEFQQVAEELADSAGALGMSGVEDALRQASSGLREVVRNNETMVVINRHAEGLTNGSGSVNQVLASGISARAKAQVFEQALEQLSQSDPAAAVELYRSIPPSIRARLRLPQRLRQALERGSRVEAREVSRVGTELADTAVASVGARLFSDQDDDRDRQEDVWGHAAEVMEKLSNSGNRGFAA